MATLAARHRLGARRLRRGGGAAGARLAAVASLLTAGFGVGHLAAVAAARRRASCRRRTRAPSSCRSSCRRAPRWRARARRSSRSRRSCRPIPGVRDIARHRRLLPDRWRRAVQLRLHGRAAEALRRPHRRAESRCFAAIGRVFGAAQQRAHRQRLRLQPAADHRPGHRRRLRVPAAGPRGTPAGGDGGAPCSA